MINFLDTSVLVPAFVDKHEHHYKSWNLLADADKRSSWCAAHSLAEVYATLTRLPGRNRLSGEQVMLFIENIREHVTPVALTADEYYAALLEVSAIGIAGGTTYDALIARCALKAKADTIYTWNLRHFEQFGSWITERLRTP